MAHQPLRERVHDGAGAAAAAGRARAVPALDGLLLLLGHLLLRVRPGRRLGGPDRGHRRRLPPRAPNQPRQPPDELRLAVLLELPGAPEAPGSSPTGRRHRKGGGDARGRFSVSQLLCEKSPAGGRGPSPRRRCRTRPTGPTRAGRRSGSRDARGRRPPPTRRTRGGARWPAPAQGRARDSGCRRGRRRGRCSPLYARVCARLCFWSLARRQRIWLIISPMCSFRWKSGKCGSGLASFVAFLWHLMGCRQECWWMHKESPPGSNSSRPLFLTRNFCRPRVLCSPIAKKWHGFSCPGICRFGFSSKRNPPPPPALLPVGGNASFWSPGCVWPHGPAV